MKIGEKTIQYITIESKHGFSELTSFKAKNNSKNFVVLCQQWEKKHQRINKLWNKKKDTTSKPYVGI